MFGYGVEERFCDQNFVRRFYYSIEFHGRGKKIFSAGSYKMLSRVPTKFITKGYVLNSSASIEN